MPDIPVDDEVFAAIQARAVPLIDTANDVLRRLLFDDDLPDAKPLRAPSDPVSIHAMLPERDYELAILNALEERGGGAPAREVIDVVGKALEASMKPGDLAPLRSGKPRWQNRVAFARLRMKEEGILKNDSPRGLWEISDAGRERLADGN